MNSANRTPLYKKVQDYIRELIHTENLVAGDRIPTEKELMERFQVSKITVVNAMAGLANENVITRVPGRGSFVGGAPVAAEEWLADKPEVEAVAGSAPAAGKSEDDQGKGVIGIILPFIHDYFAIRLNYGIQHALRDAGYKSMIMLSEGQLEQEKEAIQMLKAVGVEGLLIFPIDDQQYNDEILSMKLDDFPFVLIDRYLPGIETNYFAADGRLGIELAVEHLWQLGHRDIAICSDSPLQTVTVQERLEGYMNALKRREALINPAHMITGFRLDHAGDSDNHPLYRYIRNRMATAYITLNSELAVHIYQMAERAGLNVPDDISIISFDDPTSIVEEFSIFTHINQYEQTIGNRAAARLVEMIRSDWQDENSADKYKKVLLEPKLVVRKTTGPVPQ
ncbi:GntR family transcriptional regulator [Paenibacillus sp. GCM10027626]|uniref:GntR family transcriptional regulator n=1 Tax=Paenibacillus sp. GCM10027626 TaxID=3273411 RepID=UPI0036365F2C